jgi:hypothetical protein
VKGVFAGASGVSGGRNVDAPRVVACAHRSFAKWSLIDFFRVDFLSKAEAEVFFPFVVRSNRSTRGSNASEQRI